MHDKLTLAWPGGGGLGLGVSEGLFAVPGCLSGGGMSSPRATLIET